MKIDAVGVTSSDLKRSVAFYQSLGFEFAEFKEGEDHVEAKTADGSTRLMIDTKESFKEILGKDPKPGNHALFALRYDSSAELNTVAKKVASAGFQVLKEPWDAFWGQRYAVVEDPDGYHVDLFAALE